MGDWECVVRAMRALLCCQLVWVASACTDLRADLPPDGGSASDDVAVGQGDAESGAGGDGAGGGDGKDAGDDAQAASDGGGALDEGANSGKDAGDASANPPMGDAGSNADPVVTLTFPRAGFTTLGALHVRGTVSDGDGDAIARVTIGGVEASIDGDSWSAEVPLSTGSNVLQPIAEDARGASAAGPSVTIERSADLLSDLRASELDVANNRVLMVDFDAASLFGEGRGYALFWIDLDDGTTTPLSGGGWGSGPAFGPVGSVALDIGNGRAFVLDRADDNAGGGNRVLRVDLASGDRTPLADATTPAQPGGGPVLQSAYGLVYDSGMGRLLVVDSGSDQLLAIDASTGVRSVVSEADAGETLASSGGLRLDLHAGRGCVYAATGASVRQIDLADGTRTRIAAIDDDLGHPLVDIRDMTVDAANDRLLLRDGDAILELDLPTLVRRQVAGLDLAPESPPYRNNAASFSSVDPSGSVLYIAQGPSLLRLPLTLPDAHEVVTGPLFGNGPELYGAALDYWGGDLYGADDFDAEIMRVDIASGDRTVLADASTGSGQALVRPSSLVVHGTGNRLLVRDQGRIVAVPLDGSPRTLLSSSSPEVGTGPSLGTLGALADFVDTDNDQLLVIASDEILAVQLSTGNRTLFSGAGRGSGHLPAQFCDITFDSKRDRYVVVGDDDEVIAIHRTSGERSVISGGSIGSPGPTFSDAYDVIYDASDDRILVRDGADVIEVDPRNGSRRLLRQLRYLGWSMVLDDNRRLLMAFAAEVRAFEIAARSRTTVAGWQPSAVGLLTMENLVSDRGFDFLLFDGVTDFDVATGVVVQIPGSGFRPKSGSLPTGTFLDPTAGLGFITTMGFFGSGESTLVSVDLMTGERALISGASTAGPGPGTFRCAALDAAAGRALVFDVGLDALLGIDLQTGERVNLSGGPVGGGEAWGSPLQVRHDPAMPDRAFMLDGDRVLSVALDTGVRSVLSGGDTGTGDALVAPLAMQLDPAGNRVLVRDQGQAAFIAIDLRDGARTAFATDPVPFNPPSSYPFGTSVADFDYDPARRVLFSLEPGRQSGLVELDELSSDWVVLQAQEP
ncbi:MAG: hypothetical protein OEZ06_13785 [Myxococcales bacterium]|nr:hypothetical protein [Myxococcales bacterium]